MDQQLKVMIVGWLLANNYVRHDCGVQENYTNTSIEGMQCLEVTFADDCICFTYQSNDDHTYSQYSIKHDVVVNVASVTTELDKIIASQ